MDLAVRLGLGVAVTLCVLTFIVSVAKIFLADDPVGADAALSKACGSLGLSLIFTSGIMLKIHQYYWMLILLALAGLAHGAWWCIRRQRIRMGEATPLREWFRRPTL